MALSRSLFTVSLLLFSLLILASAGDYSYSPNSQGDKTRSQDYKYPNYPDLDKSKSEDKSKNEGYSYNYKSYDQKSEQEYHGSTHKLDVEKSNLKEKSKQEDYGYASKELEEKSKHEDDHSYTFKMEHYRSKTKDQNYTQHGHNSNSQSYDYQSKSTDNSYDSKSKDNGDEKSKSDDHDYTPNGYDSNSKSKSEGNGYEHKEDSYKSKSKSVEYHAYDSKSVKEEKSMSVTVEGLVYCKSGSRYYPIRGAVARVTCVSVDEHGYEGVPLTVYSEASDEKGYFSVSLSSSLRTYDYKYTECKAYLEKSPLDDCDVPTDVNKGISGATLNSYRILQDKKTKLYSLRTFYYASESETVSETNASAPTPTSY